MRFSEMNWFDVESYLKVDDRIIVILGSCEQHGYLSLLTDTQIPMVIADAACKKTNVVVAPPINFGGSPYFLAYPGTISLRISTLMDLIEDIIRSLYGHGFRRILFLNGHGGNEPITGRIYEIANELSGIRFEWYSWWTSHKVEEISLKHGLKSYHAGWVEAFTFTRVADIPSGEKAPPVVPGLIGSREAKQIYGDGVFGGKYVVDYEIMNEIFDSLVDDVIQILVSF